MMTSIKRGFSSPSDQKNCLEIFSKTWWWCQRNKLLLKKFLLLFWKHCKRKNYYIICSNLKLKFNLGHSFPSLWTGLYSVVRFGMMVYPSCNHTIPFFFPASDWPFFVVHDLALPSITNTNLWAAVKSNGNILMTHESWSLCIHISVLYHYNTLPLAHWNFCFFFFV